LDLTGIHQLPSRGFSEGSVHNLISDAPISNAPQPQEQDSPEGSGVNEEEPETKVMEEEDTKIMEEWQQQFQSKYCSSLDSPPITTIVENVEWDMEHNRQKRSVCFTRKDSLFSFVGRKIRAPA
jgi:hypothetical protein